MTAAVLTPTLAVSPPRDPRGPRLPIELLLHIIESTVPNSPDALLGRDDPRTQLLASFTLVCRATYRLATLLLRRHSPSIESPTQLRRVLDALDHPPFFPDPALSWRNITSLCLAPFGRSLDDLDTALWVHDMFCAVADTLRRLVVDMPFSSLDRYDDHANVRGVLRTGFARLTRLEEFVCLSEYPALATAESTTDIWRLWPDLKRLMLFNVPLADHWLWWNIATLPALEFVWLVEPKPGIHAPLRVNIKEVYFGTLPRGDPLLKKRFTVAVAGIWYTEDIYLRSRWGELDPDECMKFRFFSQGLPEEGREVRKKWLAANIENGSLWDLDVAAKYMRAA